MNSLSNFSSAFRTPPRTALSTRTAYFRCTSTLKSAGVSSTPLRCARKTPGDRFIPNRAATDAQFSSYKVGQSVRKEEHSDSLSSSSGLSESKKVMHETLLALKGRSSKSRILTFKQSTACSSLASRSPASGKYQYWSPYSPSRSPLPPAKLKTRKIPKAAEKVLDAPSLINDFYLNVLDWGRTGQLAVALGSSVYLLDTASGSVDELCTAQASSTYISSLQWNKSGKYLAVGTSQCEVQLWDVNATKLVRSMSTHSSRVSSLAWEGRGNLLTSGSQAGHIHNYDTRAAHFHTQSLQSHTLDVCGLKWSPNGRFLASGGNDNVVNVWDTFSQDSWSSPTHSFRKHTAAVKALAWCPWKPNLLATGGGSSDKCIRLWNACSGKLESTVETGSQISGLLWSSSNQELLSSHGYPHNQLTIWRYSSPFSLSKLADLSGHEERVLYLAMSPDGQSVVSAGADETLRFWKCFVNEQNRAKENATASLAPNMLQYVR